MIFNNIIVVHETIHTMQLKRKGKTGFLLAKLDMSKAYDWIKWAYMEGVMKRLGFSNKWVTLVMSCVDQLLFVDLWKIMWEYYSF